MAGIPQALTQLTEYLSRENSLLETKNKEKALNESIGQIASNFKDLGPDASIEDAQSLLFSSISEATKTGNVNAIPIIGGLFDTFMQGLTVAQQQEDRKKKQEGDKVESEILHKKYGIDYIPNDPDRMLRIADYNSKTLRDTNITTSEGTTVNKVYRIGFNGERTQIGEDLTINGMGTKEQLDFYKEQQKISSQYRIREIQASANLNNQQLKASSEFTAKGQEIVMKDGLRYVAFIDNTTGKIDYKKWTPEMGVRTTSQLGRQDYMNIQTSKSIISALGPAAGKDALALAGLLKQSEGLTSEQKKEMFNALDKNEPISVTSTINSLATNFAYNENGEVKVRSDGQLMTQLDLAISKIEDEDSRIRAQSLATESLWKIQQYNNALGNLTQANDPETTELQKQNIDPGSWEGMKDALVGVWKASPESFNRTFGIAGLKFDKEEHVRNFLNSLYADDKEGLKSLYEILKKSKVN